MNDEYVWEREQIELKDTLFIEAQNLWDSSINKLFVETKELTVEQAPTLHGLYGQDDKAELMLGATYTAALIQNSEDEQEVATYSLIAMNKFRNILEKIAILFEEAGVKTMGMR